MQKKLNLPVINQKMQELGINQAQISRELGVSKEAVSLWFKGDNFPRPAKLLRLGQLLNLSFKELVIKTGEMEPVVAFRKVRNAKTTEQHIKRAKEMGYALEKLVKYLPFEVVTKPPQLNAPKNEYSYIQSAVQVIRERLGINKITVDPDEIIKCFSKYKSILIPVLIGNKNNHENALHIHLPGSSTNWVYLNLDTKIFDFKFWLVHELGHIFTSDLSGDEAEDFADSFAGAFLFPQEIAEKTYHDLAQCAIFSRMNIVFSLAQRYSIAPYNIICELNNFAVGHDLNEIEFETDFYAKITKFVNKYPLLSENLFNKSNPHARDYIEVVEREFQTPFFEILRRFLAAEDTSSSFVRSILNVSIADSKELYNELLNGIHQTTP